MRPGACLRAGALAVVVGRLVRGLVARPPLARPAEPPAAVSIAASTPATVVVPARDEADRIRPLLDALDGAPGVQEKIVVDDLSSDATATVAAAAGARVVRGVVPPPGWAGKTWAIAQGLAAATTEWVVVLDADAVPDPELPAALVGRAVTDRLDVLSVAGRFDVDDGAARSLQAAMLAQLVHRFGPPGTGRRLANGQCLVARREVLRDGVEAVRSSAIEDVALVRHLAAVGRTVDFLDATELLTVRPYRTAAEVWSGWGRSIGLRAVEPGWRQVLELGVLAATLPLPAIRLALRRADPVDGLALALRIGTLVGIRRAFTRHGGAFWASPLLDPVAFAATVWGLLDPAPTWRGRPIHPARRLGGA